MELRQLAYLVAVADEGSFTAAARRLHVAQPGVSAQVGKLEAELGERLLDRGAAGATPTAVGQAVLEHARAALAAVDGVRGAVAEHAGLLRGRVSVGIVGSGMPPELPDLLASFAREHPGVELTLTEGRGAERLDALLDGRSDLAIVGIVGDPPAGVETATLRDEPVVAAVAPGHALAGRRRVTLAEAAEWPLIALPQGTGLRAGIDAALARLPAGIATARRRGLRGDDDAPRRADGPRVAYEASVPVTLCELARRGLGVALVPESAAEHVDGVVAIRLVEPALRGRIDLAWPSVRPVSPAGRALIHHVRTALGSPA